MHLFLISHECLFCFCLNDDCIILFLHSQVLEVLAAIRNEAKEELAQAIYTNTAQMFFPNAPAAANE